MDNNTNSQIPTLLDICVSSILKDKKYRTTLGSLELYCTLSNHFINPKFSKIHAHCVGIIRDTYPMLLTKYGYEELSKVIEEEDLAILQKQYEDSQYIKRRFDALKGTILEPTSTCVSDENMKLGKYPLAALRQGVAWPAGVDPTRREEYLIDEEFQSVFKMTLSEFQSLDKFMRVRLKKQHGLF